MGGQEEASEDTSQTQDEAFPLDGVGQRCALSSIRPTAGVRRSIALLKHAVPLPNRVKLRILPLFGSHHKLHIAVFSLQATWSPHFTPLLGAS